MEIFNVYFLRDDSLVETDVVEPNDDSSSVDDCSSSPSTIICLPLLCFFFLHDKCLSSDREDFVGVNILTNRPRRCECMFVVFVLLIVSSLSPPADLLQSDLAEVSVTIVLYAVELLKLNVKS